MSNDGVQVAAPANAAGRAASGAAAGEQPGRAAGDTVRGVLRNQKHPPAFRTVVTKVFVEEQGDTAAYLKYLAACFPASAIVSCWTILLWSSMWKGKDALDWVQENEYLWYPVTGCWVAIFATLYVLDFFRPVHLPGRNCLLWEGDPGIGRGMFALGILLFFAATFFMAEEYPSVPLVMTTVASPLSVLAMRVFLVPREEDINVDELTAEDEVTTDQVAADPAMCSQTPTAGSENKSGGVSEAKIARYVRLKQIAVQEADAGRFYRAAMTAFLLTFFVCLVAWLSWVFSADDFRISKDMQSDSTLSQDEQEELWILWSAPAVVAVANLVFGLFTALRVCLHSIYCRTNLSLASYHPTMQEAEKQRYIQNIKYLATMVKVFICIFVTVMGLIYVASQLLYTDSDVAEMFMGIMGAFFLIFLLFTYLSFRRVVDSMRHWASNLPVWQTVKAVLRHDFTKAIFLLSAMPFLPGILAFSALTHRVRRWRGIYARVPPAEGKEARNAPNPESLWLTPAVHGGLVRVAGWNWPSVVLKCYLLLGIVFSYYACPVVVNVFFAWMMKVLNEAELGFGVIIVAVFVIGALAFLLPPVPGLTVYVFGGLMMAGTCDWENGEYWAAVINIVVGFGLKLTACAIQQKIIGGMLGRSQWVRQTIGVHKLALRCMEAELRKPGWTVGKVAILCGGPDWPTSVLCGILDLSLLQCEIGTVPIIFFIIPCGLTGTFYYYQNTSAFMERMANFMVLLSLLVWLVLWAVVGWAIQNQLEENLEELSRPLPQYVDLEWLDYKTAEVQKRSGIAWVDTPRLVRYTYAVGMVAQALVCYLFWWRGRYLIGEFEVDEDLDEITSALGWDEDESLVTYYGLLAIVVYCLGWCGYFCFVAWHNIASSAKRREATQELALEEAGWKEKWLREAENWVWVPPANYRSNKSRSSGSLLSSRSSSAASLPAAGPPSTEPAPCPPSAVETKDAGKEAAPEAQDQSSVPAAPRVQITSV